MRKFAIFFLTFSFLFGCDNGITFGNEEQRILFVTSNQHFYGNTDLNTSNHFGEIVLAYDVFKKAGYEIDFVSPEGGAIPIGYINTSDKIQKKYLYNADFMKLLKHTYGPSAINSANYNAVYYSGGGAAMFGIPENVTIQDISREIFENNGVVSTICHGTAGIVNLKTSDGMHIYSGKKVNGFPDKFENRTADYYKTFPFSIEDAITSNGGNFISSEKGWDGYTIVDGRLITGQDPSASAKVAELVIAKLQEINQ